MTDTLLADLEARRDALHFSQIIYERDADGNIINPEGGAIEGYRQRGPMAAALKAFAFHPLLADAVFTEYEGGGSHYDERGRLLGYLIAQLADLSRPVTPSMGAPEREKIYAEASKLLDVAKRFVLAYPKAEDRPISAAAYLEAKAQFS